MIKHERLSPGQFYGERQSARQVGGLTLTDYRYQPHQEIPRHSHCQAYFCVLLRGSYHERYGAKARDCCAPMLIFHPEDETHSDRFDHAGGHIFSVETDAAWLARIREHGPVLAQPAEFSGGSAYALAIRLFQEFESFDTASPLAIEGLTLEILSLVLRSTLRTEPRRPAWLRTAEEYLRAHFQENMGLEVLAGDVGVHPSHFARTFRDYYHCTAGEFVRRLRVEHACHRLREPETEIAQLAAELGFADQSHFTRTFKRQTGCTPAEYRRALYKV